VTSPEDLPERCRDFAELSASLEPDETTRKEWLTLAHELVEDHVRASATTPYTAPRKGDYSELGIPARSGRDMREVCALLREGLREGAATTSPRYLGYLPTGALPAAAVADYLAAGTNPYAALATISPGAAAVEKVVGDWLCAAVGLPVGSGAALTSGGTQAVLTAVIAARDAHRVLGAGDGAAPHAPAVIYTTAQAHLSLRRALHVAGCHQLPVRLIATDAGHRMHPGDLADAVRHDLRSGLRPWLVAATAGTTNTGAVDPIDALADVCERFDLWLHVDGAYGGLFHLSPETRGGLEGLGRAQSVVVDPHKTLSLPYGLGAALLADVRTLRSSFASAAEYLPATDTTSPADLGIELTRPFRALRLWLSLQLCGTDAFVAALSEKALLARFAHDRLSGIPGIVTGPSPSLSLFVFRLTDPSGGDTATLDLVERLRSEGIAFLSTTSVDGRLWARVAVLSHRTHLEHVSALCDAVAAIASPGPGRSGRDTDVRTVLRVPDEEIRVPDPKGPTARGGSPSALRPSA